MGLAWIAYYNSLNGVFFFDDIRHLVENPKDIDDTLRSLFHNPHLPGRAVVDLTFALDYYFHELRTPGYHAVNICIHGLNGFLLFLLIQKLLLSLSRAEKNNEQESSQKFIRYLPCVISFLFIVHPLFTSCVNYIIQRYTLMATTFYLLGFLFYMQARYSRGCKRWAWFLGTIICYWLSFRSKEIALTLPLILLVYEMLEEIDNPTLFKALLKRSALLLVVFGIAAIVLLHQSGWFQSSGARLWSPWQQFQAESRAFVHYWKMLFLPISRWLNIDHDFRISGLFLDMWASLALLFHVSLITLSWTAAKKGHKLIGLGTGWFYISLFPYWLVPEADLLVNYKIYLPGIGFFLILTDVIWWGYLKKVSQYFLYAVLCGVITAGIIGTWKRNPIYQSELHLWEDASRKSPEKPRVLNNRGYIHYSSKDYYRALPVFDRAIRLDPGYTEAYINRGSLNFSLRRYEKALSDFNNALQLKPDSIKVLINQGNTNIKLGYYDRAQQSFEKAIRLEPLNPEIYLNRGVFYFTLRQYDKALPDFNRVIKLAPLYTDAYINRGSLYFSRGEYDKALIDYNRAIELEPDSSKAHTNLGSTYVKLEQYDRALQCFEKALQLDSRYAEAYYNRGILHLALREEEKAMLDFDRAIRFNPEYVPAYIKRGMMKLSKDRQFACWDFEKACILGHCRTYHSAIKKGDCK